MPLLEILIAILVCITIARIAKSTKLFIALLIATLIGFVIGIQVSSSLSDKRDEMTIVTKVHDNVAMLDLFAPIVEEVESILTEPTGKLCYHASNNNNEVSIIRARLLTGVDPPFLEPDTS